MPPPPSLWNLSLRSMAALLAPRPWIICARGHTKRQLMDLPIVLHDISLSLQFGWYSTREFPQFRLCCLHGSARYGRVELSTVSRSLPAFLPPWRITLVSPFFWHFRAVVFIVLLYFLSPPVLSALLRFGAFLSRSFFTPSFLIILHFLPVVPGSSALHQALPVSRCDPLFAPVVTPLGPTGFPR